MPLLTFGTPDLISDSPWGVNVAVGEIEDVAAVAKASQDDEQEIWIRLGNGELAVRLRHLQDILKRGAVVTEARLLEDTDESWTIWLRLSDRPGEFRLNQVRVDEPKAYRDVALAINAIRQDFGYVGPLTLSTERRFPPRT